MRPFLQVVTLATTFLFTLFAGNMMDVAFWQSGLRAEHILDGKPLPALSEFFIQRHNIISYIFLFPWLLFVGAPLVSSSPYFDTSLFGLRFIAFISLELTIITFLAIALYMPFISYIAALTVQEPDPVEGSVRVLFWIFSGAILLLSIFRITAAFRNSRRAEQGAAANP